MADDGTDTEELIVSLEQENARLRREILTLRQFIDSMQNLVEALESPRPDTEIFDLLSEVLRNAMLTIDAKDGSLLVRDEDSGELVFVVTHGDVPHDRLAWRRIPRGEGIAGWVVEHRRAAIVNDVQSDDRFYQEVDREMEFKTRSLLAAPIIGGDQVLGVIEVLNKQHQSLFTTHDQTLLTLMCRFAGELLNTMMQRGGPEGHSRN